MDTFTVALQATCNLDAIEVIDYTSSIWSHSNSCFLVPDIINQLKCMFNQYIKGAMNERVRNPPMPE